MDIDKEMPLNAAHRFERKAEKLIKQCRYEDARQMYLKASEAMNNAFVYQKCSNAEIPSMLEFQRNYFDNEAKRMDAFVEKQKLAGKSCKDSEHIPKEDKSECYNEDSCNTEENTTGRLDSAVKGLKKKEEFSRLAKVHESEYVDLKKQNKMLESHFKEMLRKIVELRQNNIRLRVKNEELTQKLEHACELNGVKQTKIGNSNSFDNGSQNFSEEPFSNDTIKSLENLLLDAIDD